MEKYKRNERVASLIKILSDNPNQLFSLNYFSELFSAAKSTISEDITFAKKIVEQMSLGQIETISGASGGVKYKTYIDKAHIVRFLDDLCEKLREPKRIIPGNYIYASDIIYDPNISYMVGQIFGTYFMNTGAEYVVTIETKGITLAHMTARALNIPLVIIRRENRVTEGSTVSINYVSGSSKRIQTMFISKRAIPEGKKVLIIDDFLKAGGTAKGIIGLMKEIKVDVVGIGFLMKTAEPEQKLINDYISLLEVGEVDEQKGLINIYKDMLFS
ncbi:pur operon repressor [Lutispora thermophila]|uniref:Purine operon repressor, PurR n=1 Tax=Lutispora thermophila DSM 19022 TaxID=1122184 RepID=A0A1M6GE98_9FIRM|nr:pur operon repressor [Lutispora thermophila]SHJ08233.1 purine operon repressor, PurR [Lutispora thermophila DSM 19022]